MREKTIIKEYCYEELENLSHGEREVWLAEQCSLFEQEVRNFFDENEPFVEDLYKKFKKVTRRWASWNHRSFGPITSREHVKELLVWERQNLPKFVSGQVSSSDPLERFENYCKKSAKLLHTFRQDIYRPLCDFFSDDEADSVIKEIPKVLEKCVQRWEALLQFSPVNEKLFSKQSEKTVHCATRNHTSESESVLRLIPDLYEKKVEALRLARRWRLTVKSKDIQRRGTYTVSPKKLAKRENMPRVRALAFSQDNVISSNKSYDQLNDELLQTQKKYRETSHELNGTKRRCEKFEIDMESLRVTCEHLRDELKQTADLRKAIEMKVNDSQMSHISSIHALTESNDNPRDKLWQKELENVKMRYSTQKIKFMNARKQVESLNKQLEVSQQRCGLLENSQESALLKCKKLEEQLAVGRKNIQTQGHMVDVLQHQCYTLKQELDQSNVKKGELCSQLTSTLDRCKTIESDLLQTRKRFKELEDETGRRKSREELLERENLQLRHLIDSQLSRRRSREEQLERENLQLKALINQTSPKSPSKKKECIFPDIKGETPLKIFF